MAINDLLGSLKRGAVRVGLGLALLGPTYATGCGDTIINNNYGSTDVEENGNGEYSCETACENIINICKPVEEICANASFGSSCWEDNSYDICLNDCKYEPWPQEVINCWSQECYGNWCR